MAKGLKHGQMVLHIMVNISKTSFMGKEHTYLQMENLIPVRFKTKLWKDRVL